MTDAYWDAFFDLHRDLPREGPGEAEDVRWAARVAGFRPDARILDAACGPGADIPALREAAPDGTLTAVDKVDSFVQQARASYGHLPRTEIFSADMTKVSGPFDFIWCAGAIYFLGVAEGLKCWRDALAPGGAIAFSQVCWFTETPSRAARAGWADYADMTDEAGLHGMIRQAGYACLDTRRLSDMAWENYYAPLDTRIETLTPAATGELKQVISEAQAEAALWRNERASFGYLLCVVRPE